MPVIISRPDRKAGGTHGLCYGCCKPGHKVKDCSTTKKAVIPTTTSTRNGGSGNRRTERGKKDIECYNCHEKGHYSSHSAMFCGQNNTQQEAGSMRSGTVEGKYVKSILLDTGCSRTLVHRNLVPEEAFLEGRALCTWKHHVV